MKLVSKLGWTVWALVPVGVLAYHYGPGQQAHIEQSAQGVLREARLLEVNADAAQRDAYDKQLAALAARKLALADKNPESAALAAAAAAEQDRAYRDAAAAWKGTAEKLREAQDMLTACGSEKADAVRLSRARATIRSGAIAEGVNDLEAMLDTLDAAAVAKPEVEARVREELATGYYYGARLMRMNGKPTSEWLEASAVARQNFRYLAEEGAESTEGGDLQKNLELVLNLEQSPLDDLLAKPLPKNCPSGTCEGLKPGKKKSKRPPRSKNDSRGAGGLEDIPGGW